MRDGNGGNRCSHRDVLPRHRVMAIWPNNSNKIVRRAGAGPHNGDGPQQLHQELETPCNGTKSTPHPDMQSDGTPIYAAHLCGEHGLQLSPRRVEMTCMSRAAVHPRLQFGEISVGLDESLVYWASPWKDPEQQTEHYVTDSIMRSPLPPWPCTSYLVVSKSIGEMVALRAGIVVTVERETRPILYEFSVLQIETKIGRWHHIEPIPRMSKSRGHAKPGPKPR